MHAQLLFFSCQFSANLVYDVLDISNLESHGQRESRILKREPARERHGSQVVPQVSHEDRRGILPGPAQLAFLLP